MNKESYIEQYSFNGNLNGYYVWSYGGYETSVNGERIGLDYWRGKLKYYIR